MRLVKSKTYIFIPCEDQLRTFTKSLFTAAASAAMILLLSCSAAAQDNHPNSPVFRDYKRPDTSGIFKRINNSYQLWQGYYLIKDANEGNVLAQHELGIRYLTGDGFPVDTPRSISWIKKAADQNLPAANYNLGIFLYNGWGVKWDPFEAYRRFIRASEGGMTEADYIVGLLLTDNLIVSRNLSEAYNLIKKASLKGYKPALEALQELRKHGVGIGLDSSFVFTKDSSNINGSGLAAPSVGLNYFAIDPDHSKDADDSELLRELLRAGREELRSALGDKKHDILMNADSVSIDMLRKTADAGSPEAQTLLGRIHEKGLGVKKDLIMAAVQYILSIRMDSPRGPHLLYQLTQQKNFFDLLKSRVEAKDPYAQFAMAGLFALRHYNQIFESDAFKMLNEASVKKNVPAINELGLCYYSGNMVKQDKQKAASIWKMASSELNSEAAAVRLAIANIQDNFIYEEPGTSFQTLENASANGSLLAQMALARCYEKGIIVTENLPKAVQLYRLSAQRGSQGAARALKDLYDQIRPPDEAFRIVQ